MTNPNETRRLILSFWEPEYVSAGQQALPIQITGTRSDIEATALDTAAGFGEDPIDECKVEFLSEAEAEALGACPRAGCPCKCPRAGRARRVNKAKVKRRGLLRQPLPSGGGGSPSLMSQPAHYMGDQAMNKPLLNIKQFAYCEGNCIGEVEPLPQGDDLYLYRGLLYEGEGYPACYTQLCETRERAELSLARLYGLAEFKELPKSLGFAYSPIAQQPEEREIAE